MTSGQHPLVPRFLVNRVWLYHFRDGLIQTPSKFGKLGTPPSHPHLLAWLAADIVEKGWSLKQLHRLMIPSTAYRQSSTRNSGFDLVNSENKYYWDKSIQRLGAEVLRDRLLTVSGKFDSRMFSPADNISAEGVRQIVDGGSNRRNVYMQVCRSKPVAFLQAFDAPAMSLNCIRRSNSTVANQSLMVMDSQFVAKYAQIFVQRVAGDTKRQIDPVAADGHLSVIERTLPAQIVNS